LRVLKLPRENLFPFLEAAREWGELWGPVRKGDSYAFGLLEDASHAVLDYTRTLLPPKKFFHPPRLPMFRLEGESYLEPEPAPNRVLFGVHPCDIHGLLILDKLFLERFRDPYYAERRSKTAILAMSCIPDDKCFCKSTNTHFIDEGFDLAFNDLKDFFLCWVGSSLGDDLIRLAPELFDSNVQHKDMWRYVEWRRWRDSQFVLQPDLTGMPDIMELSHDHPVWRELGEKCLACGSCSMVCPTCNCYNVADTAMPDGTGDRERFWDSCTLKEYSLVAGGHNFRADRRDRLLLWYTHKLQKFMSQYGKPSCVGCGRCAVTCPVDINVITVFEGLTGEEVKS
jgi:sulfhydrogenase subunit beta (sulfur reductase)